MTEPGVTSIYGKWPGISAEDKMWLKRLEAETAASKL